MLMTRTTHFRVTVHVCDIASHARCAIVEPNVTMRVQNPTRWLYCVDLNEHNTVFASIETVNYPCTSCLFTAFDDA